MDNQEFKDVVEQKPLTNWKKPPTLAELKLDWQNAKPIHDEQVTKLTEYSDNMAGTGTAAVKTPKGNSRIVPKLIRKQAEWRYASLSEPFLSTDSIFNVRPVSWEDKKSAAQNELVLNNQFNTKINKVSFIDEYIRTAVDEGTVFVQVGWDFQEVEEEVEQPIIEFHLDPTQAPMIEALAQQQQQDPEGFAEVPTELQEALVMSMEAGVPYVPVQVGTEKVKVLRTVKNSPTVEIRDARNVVIDPTCEGDLDRAQFVIYSFESSLSELRKESKYKNLDNINLDTSSILGAPDHEVAGGLVTQNFNFKDAARKKFVVYEYWGYRDIDGSGIVKPFVATWVGDTLIRMEENPFPDQKLPFVKASYLPVRKAIYGEPDGALLADNQKIMGAVIRGMIDLMAKSANGQTGMRKDMLDATNRRKFAAGLDYEFNTSADPRVGVHMHTYPEIPASAQFMLQLQQNEAESMTGVKAYASQGLSSASLGDVAAGIRGALDAASKRELGILRRLSDGILAIGRKIIAMNAEFLSEEEVVRVTNEEFVQVRKDDLGGNFDLQLSISTPEEDDNKAQQLAFMLQTIGPNEDPEIRRMLLSDICKLRKMPDLAKKLRDYQPQPDPLAQEKAQLEIELLKAELAETQAKAQQLAASAQLDMAKSGTEEVKQDNIQSNTDLMNLDFVEQESGVKQERDLQKQGEQSRAQAETKVLDHELQKERDNEKNLANLASRFVRM